MAQTGKKINELTAITTVSDETVLPAVYVSGGNPSSTANKVSIEQISNKITNDLSTILNSKQDKLTAGDNITIESNVISATDTKYTAGTNITISEQNVISADVDALPSQSGQSGKFLTTNGTDASWAEVNIPNNVWTQDNLIAGNNVTITEVQQPASYENTIVLCHLDDNLKDEVSGNNISNYITSIEYTEGKFNKGVTSSSYDSYLQFRDENNLITGNYTVDFWLYPKIEMYPNGYLYISHHSGTKYQIRLRENVFSLGAYVTGTGTKITNASYPSGVSFTLNTWHHFAYVNDDTNSKVYVFLDGNLIHSATRTYQDEGIYQVACVGYKDKKPIIFDEIRVSNVARYTSNFTPESTPYQQSETSPKYQINSTASGGSAPTLTWYTGNTGTTVTITDTTSASLVKVYKNGILLQPTEDYSISGTTLTLASALESQDKIITEVFA